MQLLASASLVEASIEHTVVKSPEAVTNCGVGVFGLTGADQSHSQPCAGTFCSEILWPYFHWCVELLVMGPVSSD